MAKKIKSPFSQTIRVVWVDGDDFLMVVGDDELSSHDGEDVATYELKSVGKVKVETTIV